MSDNLVLALDDAKLFLRVDQDAEDGLVTSAILAAQGWIERKTVLVLTRRSVTETFAGLNHPLDVRAWPVTSIDQISYFDPTGAEQQMAAGTWWTNLAARPVRIRPAIGTRWPRAHHAAGSVSVTMTAGFETAADIPDLVVHALRLLVSHFYTNRGPVEVGARAAAVEVPLSVPDMLLDWRRRIV